MSFKRPLAYAADLLAARRSGTRIGLLVVSVHDWRAGKYLLERSGTARVVVAPDHMPHELDWSSVVALDCLFVGQCADPVFWAAITMAAAAGAASLWGDFSDGIYRLSHCSRAVIPSGFYAADGPFESVCMGRALRNYRDFALMAWRDSYASQAFDMARSAAFCRSFGDRAGPVMYDKFKSRMAA